MQATQCKLSMLQKTVVQNLDVKVFDDTKRRRIELIRKRLVQMVYMLCYR